MSYLIPGLSQLGWTNPGNLNVWTVRKYSAVLHCTCLLWLMINHLFISHMMWVGLWMGQSASHWPVVGGQNPNRESRTGRLGTIIINLIGFEHNWAVHDMPGAWRQAGAHTCEHGRRFNPSLVPNLAFVCLCEWKRPDKHLCLAMASCKMQQKPCFGRQSPSDEGRCGWFA